MSRPQTRDDNDDLDIEDALYPADRRAEPLPPEGPHHRNAAGKEFVTVACPTCRFTHAHPVDLVEREAASPAPLDVERLRQALNRAIPHGGVFTRGMAADAAAEYARLTPEPSVFNMPDGWNDT